MLIVTSLVEWLLKSSTTTRRVLFDTEFIIFGFAKLHHVVSAAVIEI